MPVAIPEQPLPIRATRSFDPAPPSTNMTGGVLCLNDDYGKGDEVSRWCCLCPCLIRMLRSTQVLGLCASILTMILGVSLLSVSLQRQSEESSLSDLTGKKFSSLTRNETAEYWLRLKNQVVLNPDKNDSNMILIPGSPIWRALQWMTLEDPLRPLTNDEAMIQRFTLVSLYYSWGGDSWNLVPQHGWPQSTPPILTKGTLELTEPNINQNEAVMPQSIREHECGWYGVRCNVERQVIGLELTGQDSGILLVGTLPKNLVQLSHLQVLRLSHHRLLGHLPPQFGRRLQALTVLDLSHNRFSAEWNYSTFGALTNLEEFYLHDNRLQGNISAANLERLRKLRVLDIASNEDLYGNLLLSLMSWSNLTRFGMGGTSCTGTFPMDIGRLTHLESLQMHFARHEGIIPTSLGQCTKLRSLFATPAPGGSGFTGTLPTELGRLTNLESLGLGNNPKLNSTLPTELGLLTKLEALDVQNNPRLHGTIPTELGRLTHVTGLVFQMTGLYGSVPQEFTQLKNLALLNIFRTDLTGKLPTGFCELPDLNKVMIDCGSMEQCVCCLCS